MKTFKEFINEGKQVGEIYHFTSLVNAMKILKKDMLRGTIRRTMPTAPYGVSFTRDKNFNLKGTRFIRGTDIRFSVDGDKLSNRYKIHPHAFLGDKTDPKSYIYRKNLGDEMEEFLITPNKGINNFSKYINSITLNFNEMLSGGKIQVAPFDRNYLESLNIDIDVPPNGFMKQIEEYFRRTKFKINMIY